MENRQFASALSSYKTAISIEPNSALLQGSYGRALLAAGQTKAALKALEASRSRDFRNSRVLRDLASAYAKNGQVGMASAITAERYALIGRLEDAHIHAKRALELLDTGTTTWQRAQDVLIDAERAEKRR